MHPLLQLAHEIGKVNLEDEMHSSERWRSLFMCSADQRAGEEFASQINLLVFFYVPVHICIQFAAQLLSCIFLSVATSHIFNFKHFSYYFSI